MRRFIMKIEHAYLAVLMLPEQDRPVIRIRIAGHELFRHERPTEAPPAPQ